MSAQMFQSTAVILVGTGFVALVIAYCCGRWGDPVWEWIISHLPWLT